MGEWKEVPLASIADVQTGPFGSQLHASDYVPIGVPVIMPNSIMPRLSLNEATMSFIAEHDAERLSRYRVQEGDIIFSRRGDVDKCVLIDARKSGWFCGTGCLFARLNADAVDPTFVAYQFDGPELKNWLRTHAVGTTMPNLNSKILEAAPVALPDLPEQRAIASVLSSLDAKIDLLHRQNKTLEGMAEALFRQWFVEEEDWEEGTLDDIIEIHDSRRVPLSSLQRAAMKTGTLYPYYGAATIMDEVNDFLFDGEYVLLGEDGTVVTEDGYPVLQYATGKFWVNNHAHVLRAKPPYTNRYLWTYLKKMNIADIVTGAVQPKISQGNLKALPIVLPPWDKVESICSAIAPLYAKLDKNNEQTRSLTALRDTLLPKLMSGEVRVEVVPQ